MLFSFKVTNDLVEDTAGYQFGNNADLVAKTGLHPLVGPYGIQLGAPAAPGVVEGSAPKTIHIEVRRGEDAGTATISALACVCFPELTCNADLSCESITDTDIADCKLEPTVTAEPTETYEQTMSPEP